MGGFNIVPPAPPPVDFQSLPGAASTAPAPTAPAPEVTSTEPITPHKHGILGRLLGVPIIHPIARIGYDRFADLLYAWNRRKGHW